MFSKSTVKYIQSLQHKKFRDELNAFVAEGPKVVSELLQETGMRCHAVYATEGWADRNRNKWKKHESIIHVIKQFELEKLSALHTPNEVVAVFEKREVLSEIDVKGTITLVVDEMQDPGNFGTIIRLADWFGIRNIICSLNTVDQYNPKVVQSSMASLARVNVFYTELLEWLTARDAGIFVTALDGDSIDKIEPLREGIIIIGNESRGVRKEISAMATRYITIPRRGRADSLNAAIATGIILYALVK